MGTARSGGPRQWRRAPELSASRRPCCGACTNRWPSGGGVPAGLWTVPARSGLSGRKRGEELGEGSSPRSSNSLLFLPGNLPVCSLRPRGVGKFAFSPTSGCGPSPSAPAQSPAWLGLRGGARSSGRGGPSSGFGVVVRRPCREGWPGEAALHLRILPVLAWNPAPLSLFLCPAQPPHHTHPLPAQAALPFEPEAYCQGRVESSESRNVQSIVWETAPEKPQKALWAHDDTPSFLLKNIIPGV